MNKRKIERMCENAIGKKINIRSSDGKSTRKGWKVTKAEFSGWRNRGLSSIAQFKLTLENPPAYPNRRTDEVLVESFNSLYI
jgi:hypothetical protein